MIGAQLALFDRPDVDRAPARMLGLVGEPTPSGLSSAREHGRCCASCGAPIVAFFALKVCAPCLVAGDAEQQPGGQPVAGDDDGGQEAVKAPGRHRRGV